MNRFLRGAIAVALLFCVQFAFGSGGSEGTTAPTAGGRIDIKVFIPGGESLVTRSKTVIETAVEDKLNVNFVYEGAPWASYNDKRNIVVSSGELPDLLYSFPGDITAKWAQDGVFTAMNDYLDKAPNLKRLFAEKYYSGLTYDGKYYFYPNVAELANIGINYRKDWADTLGLKNPGTTDQLMEMMRAFTEDDPDRNGKKDTYGWSGWVSFWSSWGIANPGGPIKTKSGEVMYGYATEEYRQAMIFAANAYKRGYIYPDFFSEPRDQLYENIIRGKYGVWFENTGIHTVNRWWVPARELNPKFTIAYAKPHPVAPGYTAAFSGIMGMYGGLWTTSAIKDMSRIVQVLDMMTTEEQAKLRHFGRPNVDYTLGADGSVKLNLASRIAAGFWGKDGLQYSDWANAGFFGALPYWWEGNRYIISKVHHYNYTVDEYNKFAKESDEFANEMAGMPLNGNLFVVVPQDIADISKRMSDAVTKWQTDFITGKADPAAGWSVFIKALKDAGLDKYMEFYMKVLKDAGRI